MPPPPHDRALDRPAVRGGDGEPTERHTGPPGAERLADAAARIAAAQRWLVDELRDECSDIGVSARGFDLEGFIRGVHAFAREARRYGAPPERMLVLLKQCLVDERLPDEDREQYQLYVTTAVSAAIDAYFAAGPDADELAP